MTINEMRCKYMETFFSYETAKHTLVLTAYWSLIILDVWWFGFLIVKGVKWAAKKVKGHFQKKQPEETVQTDK